MLLITKRYAVFISIILIMLVGFSGCAKKTTVVLVPDPDGHVGHVTVANDAGSVDITGSGEATVIESRTTPPTPPQVMSPEKINAEFNGTLSHLPNRPEHFILYFVIESTTLTADSAAQLPSILSAIKRRKSEGISVVGHTDTSGDWDYNMRLSTRRAIAVSQLLIEEGVPKEHIEVTSHGEENPLVKTADNVYEPRNRRVEVVIR